MFQESLILGQPTVQKAYREVTDQGTGSSTALSLFPSLCQLTERLKERGKHLLRKKKWAASQIHSVRGRVLWENHSTQFQKLQEDSLLLLSGCLIRQWSYVLMQHEHKENENENDWGLTEWGACRKRVIKAATWL